MRSVEYESGSLVMGNWTIRRLIGEGSYGRVYEIERENFGTYRAALKVITVPQSAVELKSALEEGMDGKSARQYFYSVVEDIVREFALMSKLKGQTNIVSYEDHEVIPHQDVLGWDILIRMELLTPLLTYAYAHPFSRPDIIRLGIDMCRALELCQKYNIIHRDIKPENIFVSENGNFKLGDFGIARTVEKTMSGLSKKGTYSYMAPEVYRGAAYGFGVDIYSLGVVLYRLLNNNRIPFLPPAPAAITYSERERALARRMGGEAVPPPVNSEGRLAEIVQKACAFDPRERYSSPMQMRQELEAILYDQADVAVIYPSGDELALRENQYVSRKPVAPKESSVQEGKTEGGTQSIFGGNAPGAESPQTDGTARTESIFSGQAADQYNERIAQTESLFVGTAPERTHSPERLKKQKGKKIGLWIGIACTAVLCVGIASILASRGAVRSVSIETETVSLERTDVRSLKVNVDRLLSSEPYEPLQISVGDTAVISATYNAALGVIEMEGKSVGSTELSIGDETGKHTCVCYVTVAPRTIQIGDERFSEEAETVLISNCEMEDLRPLLEMKNLKEIVFSAAFVTDLSALGQIGTLERVTFQDSEMYDFTAVPLNVELCITPPIVREGTMGYGEQRAPEEFLIPFRFGDRAISWESTDSSTIRFDEASQTLVSGTVKHNIAAGYEKGYLMGTVENAQIDLTLSLRVGDGISYSTTSEEGNFPITSLFTIHRADRLEPVVKNCYGVDVQLKYSVQKGSFSSRFSLYISNDGKSWKKAGAITASDGELTTQTIIFREPIDLQYYTIEPETFADGSAMLTETKAFSAFYFSPIAAEP